MQFKHSIQLKSQNTMKTQTEMKTSQLTEEISIPWSALAEHERWIGISSETSFGWADSINQGR